VTGWATSWATWSSSAARRFSERRRQAGEPRPRQCEGIRLAVRGHQVAHEDHRTNLLERAAGRGQSRRRSTSRPWSACPGAGRASRCVPKRLPSSMTRVVALGGGDPAAAHRNFEYVCDAVTAGPDPGVVGRGHAGRQRPCSRSTPKSRRLPAPGSRIRWRTRVSRRASRHWRRRWCCGGLRQPWTERGFE